MWSAREKVNGNENLWKQENIFEKCKKFSTEFVESNGNLKEMLKEIFNEIRENFRNIWKTAKNIFF